MTAEAQKLVVIEDASNDDIVSSSTIQSILRHLPHKPGDELTVLAVLHQVKDNPVTLSSTIAARVVSIYTFDLKK